MTSAIVDVGRIVPTHALTSGDHHVALWVGPQVVHTAAPYDQIAQLDMEQAEQAAGGRGEGQARPEQQGLQPP